MKNRAEIQKNQLLQRVDQIIRILDVEEDRVFIIDCIKRTMPVWIHAESLSEYIPCSEDTLQEMTDTFLVDFESLDAESRKIAYERYTMIAPLLPFVSDQKKRKELINHLSDINSVSKQTIRYYLCLYLAYQNVAVLIRKQSVKESVFSQDEKNMRWALNKFFYTKNKNSLPVAYTLLLKEKYCDSLGNLLPEYPSFYQFRYFYRKTKKMQTYYISRNGLKNYQKNNRPLLGDGIENFPYTKEMIQNQVQPFASSIWEWGKSQSGANLISVRKEQIILTLLPRTTGKFSRSGLKVNKMRYKHENFTEKYLTGGEVTVAYNPDDVTAVWLIDNGSYIQFNLIESRYKGRELSDVETMRRGQKELIKAAAMNNIQAQINLVQSIEVIAASAKRSDKVNVKSIRNTRQREQTKHHIDYTRDIHIDGGVSHD
jgi:hypothetical protein